MYTFFFISNSIKAKNIKKIPFIVFKLKNMLVSSQTDKTLFKLK